MGYVEYVTAIEELSRVDGSVGIIVAAHTSLCSNHIFLAGNEAQKKKYVSKLATGEFIGAWGLTEPSSGSDAGSARMTAVRRGNNWVLNGTKTFCTNGHYADVVVVLAVTDRAAHTHGISAFVVEKDTKGFRPGKKENKLGLRASDTAELIFEDCVIPAENLLGGEGQGFPDAMRVLDGGRISIAALSLGMAEGAYEAALKYSKQRKQFGKAISDFQAIQWKLADMATEIDAALLLTMRAASMKDAGHEDHAGIFHGEALCQRSRREVRQRRRADSRRLRLHQRLSRREVLPRRKAVHHRRRHQRDSAVGDRAAVAEGLGSEMSTQAPTVPTSANLQATSILDHRDGIILDLAANLRQRNSGDRELLQSAHRYLVHFVKPVYALDELQPASHTLRKQHGSCSQRMACLEAVSRACDIPTRVRVLVISGRFWYPRFRLFRAFIPKKILLVWPQFFLEGTWVDFDELYSPAARLAERAEQGFRNDGESIFDAVDHTPIDFMAKTCGTGCAPSKFDLSRFVLGDEGVLDTRDEVFVRHGSFHTTLRGRMFGVIYGGRTSFSRLGS